MRTDHHLEILGKANNSQIVGCFCLTEMSHGSNTQKRQTTATFDKGQFVINTPNEGAIKRAYETLPGITSGDMGVKPGE